MITCTINGIRLTTDVSFDTFNNCLALQISLSDSNSNLSNIIISSQAEYAGCYLAYLYFLRY